MMEDRIETLAQKVQILEQSLIFFKQEFVVKMNVIEKLLSNKNDKLSKKKKGIEYESMLHKSLLTTWKDSNSSVPTPAQSRRTAETDLSTEPTCARAFGTEFAEIDRTQDNCTTHEITEIGQTNLSQNKTNIFENHLHAASNTNESEVSDAKSKEDHHQSGAFINNVPIESSCFEPEDIEIHGRGSNSNVFDLTSLSAVEEADGSEFSCSPFAFVKIKVEDCEEEVKVPLTNPFDEATSCLHPVPSYICNTCCVFQESAAALQVHMAQEHTDRIGGFVCHFCGKKFALLKNLNEHKRVHTEGNSFQCGLCHEINFTSSELLDSHMRRVHAIEKQVCKTCNKEFSGPTFLKRHMNIYHNLEFVSSKKRNQKCSLCPKSYRTRGDLLVHIRSHTGDRPYVCSVCQKPFADIRNLKRHQQRFPECKVSNTTSIK